MQFNTPGVTIIESQAIKNWLQAQNKQTTIASSGAGTQSCVDNVLKLTDDIINNTLPTMNKIMKSAWTSFAIEQEKAELKSLLYGLHPTDLGKDIIYKLLDNDGVHPVIDGPFIFINEKYGKSDRDYKYLIDGRGHAIDKADLSDYFDFFARTRQEIDLQNNPKIYLGVLFDGAQYNNAIQRVQCHLESNGYFDTFYAEVPLSDIIFDQNEEAEAGNYLQFDISDFGRLQSSVLLLEVDMNNNEKNIAFD